MNRRGLFVCLIGIDGSGKTTLAKSLIRSMREQGIEMDYVWSKFESSLFKFLIWLKNKTLVRESDWKENYERSLRMKKDLFRGPFKRALYESYMMVVYWFQIARRVGIPLLLGKNLVCDRYIYDTFVDLAVDLGYSDSSLEKKILGYAKLVPRPDAIFSLTVPESVAFGRKSDVPSLQFLKLKGEKYSRIVSLTGAKTLDGTMPLSELVTEVVKHMHGQHRRPGI